MVSVVFQVALHMRGVRTKFTDKLFLHHFSVCLDVIEEGVSVSKNRPACVAQNLGPFPSVCQEQVTLIVTETRVLWTHFHTSDLLLLSVHPNVLAEFPTVRDDGVTLQALVTNEMTILKHRNNLKFMHNFLVTHPDSVLNIYWPHF